MEAEGHKTFVTAMRDESVLAQDQSVIKSKFLTSVNPSSGSVQNDKFESFIELAFKSHMKAEDVKHQIKEYVKAVEASYSDQITNLKLQVAKQKLISKQAQALQTNKVAEKSELEQLFKDCVE
jgi:ABC-type phosphate transport system auxiliary subunit